MSRLVARHPRMTTTLRAPSPWRYPAKRTKGKGACRLRMGGKNFSGTERELNKKNKKTQDTACLNNPKLFFNHSLENWPGLCTGDRCSTPQPFNEFHSGFPLKYLRRPMAQQYCPRTGEIRTKGGVLESS